MSHSIRASVLAVAALLAGTAQAQTPAVASAEALRSAAQKAIAALNGRDVQGRQLNVSEAKERSDRGGGGGFSGRRGY